MGGEREEREKKKRGGPPLEVAGEKKTPKDEDEKREYR